MYLKCKSGCEKAIFYILIFSIFACRAVWCADDILIQGTLIETITLCDQYGISHTIDKKTRLIIFVMDKTAGDIVDSALKSKKNDWLLSNKTKYVADISAMPCFVLKYIALPAMRKYSYPVLLDTNSKLCKIISCKKGLVALIKLDKMHVASVEFTNSTKKIINTILEHQIQCY